MVHLGGEIINILNNASMPGAWEQWPNSLCFYGIIIHSLTFFGYNQNVTLILDHVIVVVILISECSCPDVQQPMKLGESCHYG